MMATSSSEIQDDQVEWLSTLRDIEYEICVTEQLIDANVKSNDKYKDAYISSVESCREDSIARLDQLVEKAKHEGISIHKSNDESLKQLEQTCKETKDRIEEQKSIVRDLSQKKQPRQLYVILRKELQEMRTVIKQSSFHNHIVQFAFEINSKVHNFLQSEIQEIGTLQEICMGSDEVVDDTHSLSNLSSLKLTAPPPLPPKPVLKHVPTSQKKKMRMCQLNNDDILLDTHICKLEGSCFEVYKGVLKSSSRTIAVKACFETMSEDQGKTLAKEGKLLMQFDHKNIVKLIGIAAQRKPVMLVIEQFSDGILRNYLMKNGKNMTNIQKANSCLDVANGMVYLSNNRCLHMDLRASNCMVGR
ncbi:uncharacterized protein LOC127833704 [Dreissena polymorpha]|uniref:Protein kinase domain-containing protein n=1 Tax=Dreissena polymorpha TaxID=45954 RepID=A0A9D4G6T8_DREPO|nr:uncharacterized protein LOC127833704 [Dreissena polymorpha]XP_052215081.1 uncharacterized protein LOC127833704 [Dreissena polymorpha]KAH3811523.1 hypothetical protein DPMN_139933 [Dreissena polymorpha]